MKNEFESQRKEVELPKQNCVGGAIAKTALAEAERPKSVSDEAGGAASAQAASSSKSEEAAAKKSRSMSPRGSLPREE